MPKTEMTVVPTPQADLDGTPVLDRSNPLLARTMTLSAQAQTNSARTLEPPFRALCRVLHIEPRDILPVEMCDAVDMVHAYNKIKKDIFQTTEFDTKEERDDALVVMRAYAETAGDKGYTIYTKNTEEPNILVWKVTDRRGTTPAGE
jgi:hypothetical protein